MCSFSRGGWCGPRSDKPDPSGHFQPWKHRGEENESFHRARPLYQPGQLGGCQHAALLTWKSLPFPGNPGWPAPPIWASEDKSLAPNPLSLTVTNCPSPCPRFPPRS